MFCLFVEFAVVFESQSREETKHRQFSNDDVDKEECFELVENHFQIQFRMRDKIEKLFFN